MEPSLDREAAVALFKEYNQSESLWKHALSVEAVMRHFAEKSDFNPDYWGIVGLLHDLDWERFPEEHCRKTGEILKDSGYEDAFIRAVQSHGWGIVTEIEPKHFMEKVLYATDELTGLITATVLVRPSKSILDLKVKSVKKKWKDKGFSAGVDRGIIEKGAAMLDIETTELIAQTIEAMKKVAAEIDLAGVQN